MPNFSLLKQYQITMQLILPKLRIVTSPQLRYFTSQQSPTNMMTEILKSRFPKANKVIVEDVSGGCGAMYEVLVESIEFKGLSIVKQHRLINETLQEQIKDMHGIRIQTVVPKETS